MTGQEDDPRVFFLEPMTIKQDDLLVKAHPIGVWRFALEFLQDMAMRTTIDSTDLLAEAMRDAFREAASATGLERIRAFGRRFEVEPNKASKKDRTGGTATTGVDFLPAELDALKRFLKKHKIPDVIFTSYAIDRYHDRWGKKYVKILPRIMDGTLGKKDRE